MQIDQFWHCFIEVFPLGYGWWEVTKGFDNDPVQWRIYAAPAKMSFHNNA